MKNIIDQSVTDNSYLNLPVAQTSKDTLPPIADEFSKNISAINSVSTSKKEIIKDSITFQNLGLESQICNLLKKRGLINPTPIQEKAIPQGLDGKDIIGIAQTGTGKTLAFSLPIIQRLLKNSALLPNNGSYNDRSSNERFQGDRSQKRRGKYGRDSYENEQEFERNQSERNLLDQEATVPNKVLPKVVREEALIIVPTRELALQVEETIRTISAFLSTSLRTAVLIGGAPMYRQKEQLYRKPSIIVATPGRLIDHLNQRNFNLGSVAIVVLDEADRMFDMGFAPQIKKILDSIPENRQSMFFSATMPPEIQSLAKSYLKEPVYIEITPPGTSVKMITQEICYIKPETKREVLKKILDESPGSTIVFSRTKHGATELAIQVKEMGYRSAEIHSNRSLSQRRQALDGFKSGRYTVLVATDIAARGIDVEKIQLVINYDLPDAPEDYIHRIGRTGRAGNAGRAISLATHKQAQMIRTIEKLTSVPFILSEHSLSAPENSWSQRGGRSNGSSFRRNSNGNSGGYRGRSGGNSENGSSGYRGRGGSQETTFERRRPSSNNTGRGRGGFRGEQRDYQ